MDGWALAYAFLGTVLYGDALSRFGIEAEASMHMVRKATAE